MNGYQQSSVYSYKQTYSLPYSSFKELNVFKYENVSFMFEIYVYSLQCHIQGAPLFSQGFKKTIKEQTGNVINYVFNIQ